MERARRSRSPLSVAMLDLDRFKPFNDEFGHPGGDRLLKTASAAWLGQIRESDLLARCGGDEFILLLPDAQCETAIDALDRLRAVTRLGQTISAGLASWDFVETSDELIGRADRALYQAKKDGRNRTTIATPPAAITPPRRERAERLAV
jgi:diguanylate cyclase (GGDEF)-like protein